MFRFLFSEGKSNLMLAFWKRIKDTRDRIIESTRGSAFTFFHKKEDNFSFVLFFIYKFVWKSLNGFVVYVFKGILNVKGLLH